MKLVFRTFLVLTLAFATNAQSFYGSTDEKVFRNGRNMEMCDKVETPLLAGDYSIFKELSYFKSNASYRFVASFEESDDEKQFNFETSAGAVKKYIKKGSLYFKINGKDISLSIFQSSNVAQNDEFFDLWFVPFKDLTNKTETYSGGRYLSIWKPKDRKVILDFNMAYNPSCAYGSGKFSCPIPPKENFLSIEIPAGEKKFVSQSKIKH
jgi:uncharacterized protein